VDDQIFPNTREDLANADEATLVGYLSLAYRAKEQAAEQSANLSMQLSRWYSHSKDASRRIALIKSVLKERL
jgi:hypothetical protein